MGSSKKRNRKQTFMQSSESVDLTGVAKQHLDPQMAEDGILPKNSA